MADDDVVILNQGLEMRTSKAGKMRCSIKIVAEPLVHDFDAKQLGRGPAQAIARHLREAVEDLAAPAAPATVRFREAAKRAFAEGAPWATARYAGGRIGAMTPDESDRAFNDSGRFARSIVANASSDDSWRVNVAANRLQADNGADEIWGRLVALVPEFADAESLLEKFAVRRAVEDAQRFLIRKEKETGADLSLELVRSILEVAKALDETIDELANVG